MPKNLTKSQEELLNHLTKDIVYARDSYETWIMKADYHPYPTKEDHRLHPTEADLKRWNENMDGICRISGVNNNVLTSLERKGFIKILPIKSTNSNPSDIDEVSTCDTVIQVLM